MEFRFIKVDEIRHFGDDLFYDEAERFLREFRNQTNWLDSKIRLTIFGQKLVLLHLIGLMHRKRK